MKKYFLHWLMISSILPLLLLIGYLRNNQISKLSCELSGKTYLQYQAPAYGYKEKVCVARFKDGGKICKEDRECEGKCDIDGKCREYPYSKICYKEFSFLAEKYPSESKNKLCLPLKIL